MEKKKKYGVVGAIAVITLVALLLTYSFLPVFLRDTGGLYKSYEKAQWYLEDDRYSELVIEYDYTPDSYPNEQVRDMLEGKIEKYCEKDSVETVLDDQISFNDVKGTYTQEYVQMLTDKYQDYESDGDELALHIMFLNGAWEEDNVLGLTYGGNNIVIFEDQIRSVSSQSSNLNTVDIEKAVLVHEFGHVLGLVGIDYDSDHNVQGHHCDESDGDCVMAASVEVRVGGFSEKPPTDFCSLCQNDILDISGMEDGWGLEEYMTTGVLAGEGIVGMAWVMVVYSEEPKKEHEVYNEYYGKDFEKKGGKKLY